MPIEVRCDTCDAPVSKSPSLVKPHNFCSDSCYRTWRRTLIGERSPTWRGGAIALMCAHCGKKFAALPSEATKRRYCSVECKASAQQSKNVCRQCGKVFAGMTRRLFCCRSCYRAFRLQHPQPVSATARRKISLANTGRIGRSGEENAGYRNGQSITITKPCSVCGTPFKGRSRQQTCSTQCAISVRAITLRRFYRETPEGQAIVERYAQELRRLGNPSWLNPAYAPGFTSALKRRIVERDGGKCRRCGTERLAKRHLAVHHIDGRKTDHSPSNLITLCRACHMYVHRRGVNAIVYMLAL